MNKRKLLGVVGSICVGSLILASSAQATLILRVSDGTSTATRTDLDGNGAVIFIGSIGDWVLNVTTGVTDPMIGDNNSSRLDLSSINVSGSSSRGGTLYISLTDTGNTVPIGDTHFSIGVGGFTDGSISFRSYVDSTNTAFGTETLLHNTGLLTGSPFSSSGYGAVSVTGPYSITTVATLTHDNGFSISGFGHDVKVPEPRGLAVLGIGLLGLAFGTRRAVRKS
jgi:hypothetical protein